jgi:hypothetical protein
VCGLGLNERRADHFARGPRSIQLLFCGAGLGGWEHRPPCRHPRTASVWVASLVSPRTHILHRGLGEGRHARARASWVAGRVDEHLVRHHWYERHSEELRARRWRSGQKSMATLSDVRDAFDEMGVDIGKGLESQCACPQRLQRSCHQALAGFEVLGAEGLVGSAARVMTLRIWFRTQSHPKGRHASAL